MTEQASEYSYFFECRNALITFGKEHNIKGWNFIAKHIPNKLAKAGLLFEGTSPEVAKDLCLTYAALRQELIMNGVDTNKAGDQALDTLLEYIDNAIEKIVEDNPMPEQKQDNVAAEYELTVFPSTTGAIYHKASGIALATSLQIRSNNPDALFYLPQQVEHLMANIMELVDSGHYAINYPVLAKDFRDQLESQGLPPQQLSDLDKVFGEHPAKAQQGNATPKGNSQQSTRPANTQNSGNQQQSGETGKLIEIAGVELIQNQNGKLAYKWLRNVTDQNGATKTVAIEPGMKGEYRTGTAEIILKALGFSTESISAIEVGDRKQAKNTGVKAECVQRPNPNNPQYTVTNIVAYHLADGKVIK